MRLIVPSEDSELQVKAAYNKLSQAGGGLLVVGHGTRLREGQTQLLSLGSQIAAMIEDCPVEAGFLELAEPDIATAVERLSRRGVTSIFVMPILLFNAAHAKDDIPEATRDACKKYGIRLIGQADPLECRPEPLALSQMRCLQSLLCSNERGCNRAGSCELAKTCCAFDPQDFQKHYYALLARKFGSSIEDANNGTDGKYLSELCDRLSESSLVMIGRGTTQEPARQSMREFARLKNAAFRSKWLEVGFFAGDPVDVELVLKMAGEQSQSHTVIVQPHLLFEGVLTDQLRKSVDSYRNKYPHLRWLVTAPLGGDSAFANMWLRHAAPALTDCLKSL